MNNNTKNGQKEQGFFPKGTKLYLDASFLIEAITSLEEKGDKARSLLEQIKSGLYEAYTSTLSLDEVAWVVQRKKDRNVAAESWESLFGIPHLEFIAVDTLLMQQSLEIYKKWNFKPRDAIHMAAMKSKVINLMLSEDTDFDDRDGITRIAIDLLKAQ